MSHTVLGAGDIAGNKTRKDPCSNGTCLLVEKGRREVNYDALGNCMD